MAKRIAVLIGVMLNLACVAVAAGAQENRPGYQIGLDDSISNFKAKVARLTAENRDLALSSERIKAKLRSLAEQMKELREQEEKTVRQMQTIEPRYQKRSSERASLEGRLQQAVDMQQAIRRERLAAEESVASRSAQDKAVLDRTEVLRRETADIRDGLLPKDENVAELEPLRAEQNIAQKELDETSALLTRTSEEWKELSVAINAGPHGAEAAAKDQQAIKDAMGKANTELAEMRTRLDAAQKQTIELTAQASPQAVAVLEKDIQQLTVQAQTLESENVEVAKVVESRQIAPEVQEKIKRDQARLKELQLQNKDLQLTVKDLQRSMVNLDKKKLSLEKGLN